jgi:hypothetical protein
MSVAETQYFALLRAALWGAPVDIEGAIDWKTVMQMAFYHGNNVLLSDVAVCLTDEQKPSPKMMAKMQDYMRGNLMLQMRQKRILFSAVKLLREHGIEPVVLKGFGLAGLYPNPCLRQSGDIDLFVGLDSFHEACALLRTIPNCYYWCEEVDSGRHYNIEFGDVIMEIHRVSADVVDASEHQVYAAIEREGLKESPQRIVVDGFELSVPSREFMVFFTFYHAWHHFTTTGVGWRQLSDVAMALHAYSGQLDLEKLREWLITMHLIQPWQTFGFLMVDCLGLPQTEMPFFDASCQSRARIVYKRVMKEGNFRRERSFRLNRPKKRLWQKIHAFICTFIDFFHLVGVFPRYAFHDLKTSLQLGFRKNFQKK